MANYPNLTVVKHPLITHKLTMMRDKNTNSKNFRDLCDEVATLMTFEVTRDWELTPIEIETPMEKTTGYTLKDTEITIVPILRAGLGFLNGVMRVIPKAHVGHLGVSRDPKTHLPVEYYCGLPKQTDSKTIIVDPMLATGGSFDAAITLLKDKGFKDISCMVLVAAPEGVEMLLKRHPDVMLYTASLDRELNENAYILPGLGDAGDRIFGTL